MRALVTSSMRVVWAALLSLALLPSIGPVPARAEEVLQFKPVPPESASKLEHSSHGSRRVVVTPPDHPDVPEPPVPPEPPDNLGRSGDIMRLGSDVTIEKGQVVDGDVVAIGGDVKIEGQVRGDVAALGGDLHLGSESRVNGDVACLGGALTEEPGAFVGGQRVTAVGAFHGKDKFKHLPGMVHEIEPWIGVAKVAKSFVWLLVLLALCWAYITFAPQRTATVVSTIRHEPGHSLLAGFLSLIMIVPSLVALAIVMVILCITIIGIPVAIAALFVYLGLVAVLLTWGFVGGIAWFGERIPVSGPQPVALLRAALIGTLVVQGLRIVGAVLQLVPFVGWVGGLMRFAGILGWSLAVMIGAGALIRSKIGQGPQGRWWPILKSGPPRPIEPVPAMATSGGIAPPPATPGPGTESAPPSPLS
jgi:hypothetical protein